LSGWRLLSHRPLGSCWRYAMWLAVMLSVAMLASCMPRTAHWPLPTGLGGVLGDALLRTIGWFGVALNGFTLTVIGLALVAVTTVLFAIAAGVRLPERLK